MLQSNGMKVLDLTKVLKNNKQGWVALTPDRTKLVSHAQTLEEVLQKARKAKVANPTVFKIGPFNLPFVGHVNDFSISDR